MCACACTCVHEPHNRYGQLSGLVEPVAGLLGAFLVSVRPATYPYAERTRIHKHKKRQCLTTATMHTRHRHTHCSLLTTHSLTRRRCRGRCCRMRSPLPQGQWSMSYLMTSFPKHPLGKTGYTSLDMALNSHRPHARLATWCGMLGFVVMMALDVGLG